VKINKGDGEVNGNCSFKSNASQIDLSFPESNWFTGIHLGRTEFIPRDSQQQL